MKLLVLTALAALGSAGAALAETCVRPTPPAAVDGATATMEQMLAAKTQTAAFMTASDTFQSCVIAELTAQRDAAKAAKTKFDKTLQKTANTTISENQADKVKVGADFNGALRAYKAAHPG